MSFVPQFPKITCLHLRRLPGRQQMRVCAGLRQLREVPAFGVRLHANHCHVHIRLKRKKGEKVHKKATHNWIAFMPCFLETQYHAHCTGLPYCLAHARAEGGGSLPSAKAGFTKLLGRPLAEDRGLLSTSLF